MSPEERDLLKRCARGDESAYRELVERFERPLIQFIVRYVDDRSLAEDLFQDTFVRVLKNLRTYRPEGAFSTWLYTIARNLCLDHIKHVRKVKMTSMDTPVGEEGGKVLYLQDVLRDGGPAPEARAELSEEEETVRACLGQLAPVKKEALILRVYHNFSYQEIAEITDCPVGTAKYRVHEAMQDLGTLVRAAADGPAEEAL
ncbi:MAG: sigma-70 family RNA polymerase sigma factor [Candidatus Brocadiae bacterium]|nr:sigma-70 family RNA polymerase sigma factor [Candidatus Brocadiia bacterium]